MRQLMLLAGIAVVGIVSAALCVDTGEVVTLISSDDEGHTFETPLWIVEVDGALYLRGTPGSGWMERLRAHPEIQIARDGETLRYRATPIDAPAVVAAVNRAMAEKYGAADRVIGWVADPARRNAVRLEPSEASGAAP